MPDMLAYERMKPEPIPQLRAAFRFMLPDESRLRPKTLLTVPSIPKPFSVSASGTLLTWISSRADP